MNKTTDGMTDETIEYDLKEAEKWMEEYSLSLEECCPHTSAQHDGSYVECPACGHFWSTAKCDGQIEAELEKSRVGNNNE